MKQLVAIVAYYMFGYLIFWTFLHETDLFPKVWVQDNFSIAIWGRSMGAVSALLFASNYNKITSLCLDSPFQDLNTMIKEVVSSY